MAQATAIEWTDVSWNPVHGCSKVSPGCAHCYAETLSLRYRQTTKPWTPANAADNVVLKHHKLREPLSRAKPWNRPCRVFVNSMSDLFHELVDDDFIGQVFDVMAQARQHTFQVLTKRPERMRDFRQAWHAAHPECGPLPNVWLGTSIENRRYVHRADLLRSTPAAVRFISAEPLLGPLICHGGFFARGSDGYYHDDWPDGYIGDSLSLGGIDWLIVGGESGPGCRPMSSEWVRDLHHAAKRAGTAFFLKQWGGPRPGGPALLDGREWREFPGERTNREEHHR